MVLNTDLHASPYFDDYDEDKNYHKILFKPTVAVQARELTQLQSILQNQVERFGDNILQKGTIVKGGNFYDYKNIAYVKLSDNSVNGSPVNVNNFAGASLRGVNSGVTAIVSTFVSGNVSQSPNLNTLYVKYTGSGIDGSGKDIKTFIPGEVLEVSINNIVQPDISVAVASFGVDRNPIGIGYAVSCGDGVIYQKGHFIRFENQITVVSKYNNLPDNVVIGFATDEEIITAEDDNSLYNNAGGFINTNTPGADRIKLTPKLVVYTKEEAELDENFLAIQEYQEGRLIRRNVETQFNSISKELEKRTYDESGNYSVTGYTINIGEASTKENLELRVSPGISYVNGKRVETIGRYDVDIRKATDFESVYNQDILANYGNYIYVDNIVGSFPFDSMNTINLRSAAQVASSVVGFTPAGSIIGTARVLSYDKESAGRYRVYLFDIKMTGTNLFSSVRSINSTVSGSIGFANLILESSRAVLKDTNFKSLIFPLGHDAVKEIITANTDYVYRRKATLTVGTTGNVLITASGDEAFPYTAGSALTSDSIRDIIITNSESGVNYDILSASNDESSTVLSVNIGTLPASQDIDVIYNVKRLRVRPTGKTLRTVYVRIDPTNNTDGTFYLGWPDVHSIEGIWRGSNTTFTEASAGISDVKSNFSLNKNANDLYYGISFIKKSSAFSITSANRFLVKAKVFVKETTGSYSQSFFCINSYPIDDTSEVLPSNRIRTEEIPSGLRDVIDFRPYVTPRAAYATTAASASIGTSANNFGLVSFQGNPFISAPNRALETSYSYYLARRDRLVINDRGEFVLIEGETSINPTYPQEPSKSMTVARITVPPFPSLTPSVATRSGYPEYGVKVEASDNRRYTMNDIRRIDDRISNIEYYTILNALEKSAEDMVVKDSDGLNRFKNGIFVDNFENMLTCEVKDPDFSASVDAGESALYPRFRAYNLEFANPTPTGGVVLNNNTVATMTYNSVVMEQQRFATKFRSCVTDFYNFEGVGYCFPEYDNGYDETYAPDININVNISGAFSEFTSALSEIVPLTVKDVNKSSSVKRLGTTSSTAVNVANGARTTTVTSTTKNLVTNKTVTDTSRLVKTGNKTNTQQVGDFITNVSMSPFLRANVVRVAFTGLRPNTRFWSWFDGKTISSRSAPARFNGNNDDVSSIIRTGKWGDELRSNSRGELIFMISIPAETFYVGDREILVMDVSDLLSEEAATSTGIVTYRGFNFSVEKTGLELSTRTPTYDVAKTRNVAVNKKIVTSQEVVRTVVPIVANGGGRDPIAQTIYVDPSYTNSDSVMVTKVDIAFNRKSADKGITLQLRKTINGYPSDEVLPFGSVRLNPSQVSVSSNASAWTTFTFKSPITLAAGESYSIVLIPDGNSPDYLVYCAKTGQNDLRTGSRITSDVNSGTLFTSTNNMAWTPYQDENLTFVIHKAQFTDTNGDLLLHLNDYEFFDLSAYTGKFERGETVFAVKANLAGTVSTTNGSNVITGSGTTFTNQFAAGDVIAIFNSADSTYDVARVVNITNNTSMTVDELMKDTRTGRTYFKTVSGIVDYFNTQAPERLFLKRSTAKTGSVFAAGDTLRGENTNATAIIENVIYLPISHYQANIYRTNFDNTDTKLALETQTNSTGARTTVNIAQEFGENNRLGNVATVIKSRSREITENGGARSFRFRVNLSMSGSGPHYISPVVDYAISGISAFEYLINASSTAILTSERRSGGDSTSKSITKKVTLRDGLDAEDLKVWLTAYRPVGTEINVFVKFIADIDQTPVSEIPWTMLRTMDNQNLRSSSTNLEDYKEIEYSLGSTDLGVNGGAFVSNGNFTYRGPNGEVYDNYKHFIIKIVLNSVGQHRIPKVKDIRAIALT